MKVEIEEKEDERLDYPCLKTHIDGLVVFFTKENTGIVVSNDWHNSIGTYRETWKEEEFVPFNGVIKLSNK